MGRAPVKAPKSRAPRRLQRAVCGLIVAAQSRLRAATHGCAAMTQTTGRFFDELGKLITDAAGAADGVRKEVETIVRAQAERVLNGLDVVQREEFEAVKAMAQKAREENERLAERLAALEATLKGLSNKG